MRIRIPRRFLLLGILLATLALVATSVATAPSYAKPINWDYPSDPSSPPPPTPKGDTDGGLQKSGAIRTGNTAYDGSVWTSWSTWRKYFAAVRLGYGWHWTW